MKGSHTEKCTNGKKHRFGELWDYNDKRAKFDFVKRVCAVCGKDDVNETMGDVNGGSEIFRNHVRR